MADISPSSTPTEDAEKKSHEEKTPVPPSYEVAVEKRGTLDSAVQEDGSIDFAAGEITSDIVLDTSLQLVTKTLDLEDDPTENAFTFRAFVIGIGLAAFGAVIAEIFYFKPQTINVNVLFLEIIAYVLGEATTLIPRWGAVGRFLNPGPFNQKEHVFITIMVRHLNGPVQMMMDQLPDRHVLGIFGSCMRAGHRTIGCPGAVLQRDTKCCVGHFHAAVLSDAR